MKKRNTLKQAVNTFLLIILLTTIPSQSARAFSGFTLSGGVVTTGEGSYDQSFYDFWRNLVIEFSDDGSGVLTGSGDGAASAYNTSTLTNSNVTGWVSGVYDPNTGLLSGEYTLNYLRVFHKETSADINHYETSQIYQGSYQVQLHPGDTAVNITFKGTMTQQVTGDYPPGWTANGEELNFTMNWGIGVQFAIEGTVEMTAPVTSPAKTEPSDSGARFSDLSGQVEVLLPTGIDENGKYIYDEEAWTFAKLDMVLPEGTHIRTQDRSTVILSFADMTTFEQKPETEIVLSPPDPKKSHFQLIYGNLMANVKKVIKDGTMEIEMSQAVCGIKGTIFVLKEDGAISTLKVLDGTVEFTSTVTGETQTVSAGQMSVADANGLGALQSFDATAEGLNWSLLQTETEAQETTAPAERSVLPILLILTACFIGVVGLILLVVVGFFVVRGKKKPL